MNNVQHVKWCMKQTKLTSESSCPTDSCLEIRRSWFQSPLGAIFDEFFFFFALPCVKICQIIWQKRLSWKTKLYIIIIISTCNELHNKYTHKVANALFLCSHRFVLSDYILFGLWRLLLEHDYNIFLILIFSRCDMAVWSPIRFLKKKWCDATAAKYITNCYLKMSLFLNSNIYLLLLKLESFYIYFDLETGKLPCSWYWYIFLPNNCY